LSGALNFLFPSANAASIGSFDANAPGGIVQVPVGPNYLRNFPGATGLVPGQVDQSSPIGISGETNGSTMTITPNPLIGPLEPPLGSAGTQMPSNLFGPGQLPAGTSVPLTATVPQAAGGVGGILSGLGNMLGVGNPLNWLEELAIRAMLVLIGLVLIAGGFYTAGNNARLLRP
jgi:hypothetical protein